MSPSRGRATAWPYVLFLLSGLAGLVFETVFLRQLSWVLGSSAVATALVLAAFMAGLAIGAAWFGRMADRHERPLRLYGLLELGVAASAGLLVWLLASGRSLFFAVLRPAGEGATRSVAEFVLAFGLVLAPAILMGGTLPAMCRHVVRGIDGLAGSLALLYALNTLGAAAGVFLAGFLLFESLGVTRSAWLAAAGLTAIGLTAIGLDRGLPDRPARSSSADAPARAAAETRAVRLASAGAAAAAGFALLGFEVLWTRMLSLFMRSYSYSFSLMLSLFLFGLFIGAALLSLTSRRIGSAAALMGWLQVAMGLYAAATLVWLPEYLVPVQGATSFGGFLAASTLRAAWIVLPPTILSGMALPLAARAFATGARSIARDVGLVYALNTAGAVAGALTAGLLLLPRLGAPRSVALLALVAAAGGCAVLLTRPGPVWRKGLAVVLAAACLGPLALSPERFIDAFLEASPASGKITERLLFHEGATDTVAIVRRDYGYRDPDAKSLITNGFAMAATVKPIWRYMALEGHLPVLFAARPRSALTVGVGTGITLGALVSHPDVGSVVAVELSEGVIRGLDVFAEENGSAHRDGRVELVRGDGRHHLELSRDRYDLITLEPPPPIVAGSAHLYSLDFYDLCRSRLAPGGVLAQWLPLHAQSLASARMTARTLLEAFPHVTLWLPSIRDAVLIASSEPQALELDRLLEAYAEPVTARNLKAAYLETPEALLATFLLDRAGIERWVGDAPVITDERPLMEFFRSHAGNMKDRDIGTLLELPQGAWTWLRGADLETLDRVERENQALRLYLRSEVQTDLASGIAATQLSSGTEFFLYRLGCALEQLERLERTQAAVLERCRGLRARRDELAPAAGAQR